MLKYNHPVHTKEVIIWFIIKLKVHNKFRSANACEIIIILVCKSGRYIFDQN